jgi:hypothetical protein
MKSLKDGKRPRESQPATPIPLEKKRPAREEGRYGKERKRDRERTKEKKEKGTKIQPISIILRLIIEKLRNPRFRFPSNATKHDQQNSRLTSF